MARVQTRGTVEAGVLLDELADADLKNLLTEIALSRYELSRGWEEQEAPVEVADPLAVARDVLLAIKRARVQRDMTGNQRLLKEASQRNEDVTPFLQRQQELIATMRQLEALFARPKPGVSVSSEDEGA